MQSQPNNEHTKDATAIRFVAALGGGGCSVTGASWIERHTLYSAC
jgi:hypothetical protein